MLSLLSLYVRLFTALASNDSYGRVPRSTRAIKGL